MGRRQSTRTGWRLVVGGVAVLLAYVVLVWSAVYGNDESQQPCDGAHRDILFPPATVCGTGASTVRITSIGTTVAASVLLLIGLVVLVVGATAVVRAHARRTGS